MLTRLLGILFLLTITTIANNEPETNNELPPPSESTNSTGDSNKKTTEKGLSDLMKTASLALTDPRLAAAIELIKNIKTESSTTIGEIQNAKAGFYEFNTDFEIASGTILSKNIDKLIRLWLTNSFFDTMPKLYKSVIADSIEELSLQMENTNYMKQRFSIHFQDGKGTVHMLVIMFEYDPVIGGTRWTKQALVGGFVPARDWVIVTRSRSNILSSSRTDEIVYMPPYLSREHIENFMKINKEMILSFYKQFTN